MAEYIKLTSIRDLNSPIGESLIPHEPLIQEIVKQVLRLSSDRGRSQNRITLVCAEAADVLLATVIANIINKLKYNPSMHVAVLSPLIPFSEDGVMAEAYEYSSLFLVKATIKGDEELIKFKENINELIDMDDSYYTGLLTLTPFSFNDQYSAFLPTPVIQKADSNLIVGIKECLSYFGWVIGL